MRCGPPLEANRSAGMHRDPYVVRNKKRLREPKANPGMPTSPKRPGRSFSDERQLIALAKTSDLETIAKRIGKKPEAILKMARRLGLSVIQTAKTRAPR
jgi:hypothetical protein